MSLPDDPITFGTPELAYLTGYAAKYLYALAEQGHIPTPAHGRWPEATIKALFSYLRAQVKQQSSGKLAQARLRTETARADVLEERVAKSRGELIEAEEVREAWEGLVLSFRTKILAVPPRLAPQMLWQKTAVEAEAVLTRALREALEELSKQ